jgi:hypothetical protein
MLFDNRSNYILSKGLFEKHLIECFYFKYREDEQNIYFKYPLLASLPNQYTLKVHIQNKDLYYKINHKIYNKDFFPIVIAGDWKRYGYNAFESEVNSYRQIYLPKH